MDSTWRRQPSDRRGGLLNRPDIIAATYREDHSADLLIVAAQRRGVDVYRFNTEDYPASIGLDVDPLDPTSARLLSPRGTIELGRVRGLWIRRPQWPQIAEEVTDPLDRAFAQQEAVAAMGGVWRALADRCISPPDALQAARWKVPQLSLAKRLGLRCPRTLVSNDPERVREFLLQGPAVVKAVADARVVAGTGERHGQTHVVGDGEDLSGVRAAPVLVQELVPKIADVRVTVVGSVAFAVRITTPPGAPVDFRVTPSAEAGYEVVTLGDDTLTSLREFVRAYGLRFAAFDFAEDQEGRLWFLECNPNGQWGWLERPTGLDITGALVQLLLNP